MLVYVFPIRGAVKIILHIQLRHFQGIIGIRNRIGSDNDTASIRQSFEKCFVLAVYKIKFIVTS